MGEGGVWEGKEICDKGNERLVMGWRWGEEAGKITMHIALWTLLYGIRRGKKSNADLGGVGGKRKSDFREANFQTVEINYILFSILHSSD